MFKVITGAGHSYVGCSERLAADFYAAAEKAGHCVLMMRRIEGGSWVDVRESIPTWGR